MTKDVTITAAGRADWIGWAELRVEPTDEVTPRLTAKVLQDVNADIVGVVEAEDRPSLVRFNRELVGLYRSVMLVDGNDDRGIDVGIMVKSDLQIRTIRPTSMMKMTWGRSSAGTAPTTRSRSPMRRRCMCS